MHVFHVCGFINSIVLGIDLLAHDSCWVFFARLLVFVVYYEHMEPYVV